MRCITHGKARTTETAHIINNSAYGVSLMFADEAARLCRHYGVDYREAVMKYTETHNRGFLDLDHPGLVRSILWPPGGRVGGHCVVQGASLIPDGLRGPLMSMLARYNDAKKTEASTEPSLHGVSKVPREDTADEELERPKTCGPSHDGGPGQAQVYEADEVAGGCGEGCPDGRQGGV